MAKKKARTADSRKSRGNRPSTSRRTTARKATSKSSATGAADSREPASARQPAVRKQRKPVPHCNELDGKRWLQNSISVWSDIRKTREEARMKHPAMFPAMLVQRLIETFLRPEADRILDPFCGSGSTIVCAERLGKAGTGLELAADYVEMARARLHEAATTKPPRSVIHHASVDDIDKLIEPESIDLCITSPPYWNILNQKRTADYKQVRHYGNQEGDLGTIEDYDDFLDQLKKVFASVFVTLKPGAYCCIIVMDLRKKNRFFPFHSDLASRLTDVGYIFDDLIIWNRQSEYNNLRPLGYPAVFRINKVHEFVVLMQKPRA